MPSDVPTTPMPETPRSTNAVSATRPLSSSASQSAFELPPGTVVGDFRLERVLGKPGGQGVVYKATQISLNRQVALKLLRSGRSLSERLLARFQREAEAGSRIAHPGLAAVYAFGEADGRPFLAQELVTGGDLGEHLDAQVDAERGADDYRTIATLFAELCDGLQAAHDAGVIHRDLKPANILLTDEGHPKVVDFGLAKVLDAESLSVTGSIEGTPFYMSPEQADARALQMDHRTDVYSLGATLYEALTLTRPFQADTLHQLVQKVLREDPIEPTEVRSRIPQELSVIALKAMAKRREDRYRDMAAFGADLRRWLDHEPILARPPGPLRRARTWALRHPTASTVLAVALVSVGVFAWLTAQLSDRNAELGDSLQRETALSSELGETNAALVSANDTTRAALDDARAQRALADERAAEARRQRANVLRLSAFQQLQDLRDEADALWPVEPERVAAYDDWLRRADALVAGLQPSADGEDLGHLLQLQALRERALPRTAAAREAERRAHPDFAAWQAKATEVAAGAAELAAAEEQVAAAGLEGSDAEQMEAVLDEARAALATERETLAQLDAQLDARVDARRTYAFDSADDAWWHNQLVALIAEIEAFTDPGTGLVAGVSPTHGWGIATRRELAASLDERTVHGDDAARRWAEARASIADVDACPPYAGLQLAVQPGLLPLGRDPDSGLWEFWHVLSGDEPARDASGRLVLAPSSGIVLVLIPGGPFGMGSGRNPGEENLDPRVQANEEPVHLVELTPYMLAKHELTQAQWERITGVNPSMFMAERYFANWNAAGEPWSGLHPVEQVNWFEARTVLGRLGLALPTEAQWERACRGGTRTPWSTGAQPESLQGSTNLSDVFGKNQGNQAWAEWEDWLDDGHTAHAPVGSYAPNPFGLHDMHGNVWEWVFDGYDDGFYRRSPRRDPVNPPESSRSRVFRGGSYMTNSSISRSAFRHYNTPEKFNQTLGVRAAWVLRE